MAEFASSANVINTDILIIGGGIAGLFAGVRAKQYVDNVIVVDKGPIGYTSQCYYALGGHQTFLPEDNIEEWVKDVMYFQDGLCEQDLVESIYKETFDRIKDFERWGVKFITEPDGKYRRFTTRGIENVRGLRPHPHGIGGKLEVRALVQEAKKTGVKLLSRIFIADILKSNGTATGAIGFDTRSGELYIFNAGAVVIATGECSFKCGSAVSTGFLTGDGMAMALRAGAQLVGLEFPYARCVFTKFSWEAMGTALPMGAVLVNANGEKFMDKYSPSIGAVIDYNYLARAMAFEARAGNGPLYIDYSLITPQNLKFLRNPAGWMGLHVKKLEKAGIRPFDQKQEITIVLNTIKGIKADIECQIAVPGLFAGGRVRGGEPGVVMGSFSIAYATVTGCRAGEKAAKYAKSSKRLQIDENSINMLGQDLFAPLGRIGAEPEQVLTEIQKTVLPYKVLILKTEDSLQQALSRVEYISDKLLVQMGARDVHYLVELLQVKNMALVAEGMIQASLMRTESRGSHYREDYPRRDDNNWLKHIVITHDNGQLKLSTEPLPLDKYKFKPSRYYSDNFRTAI